MLSNAAREASPLVHPVLTVARPGTVNSDRRSPRGRAALVAGAAGGARFPMLGAHQHHTPASPARSAHSPSAFMNARAYYGLVDAIAATRTADDIKTMHALVASTD